MVPFLLPSNPLPYWWFQKVCHQCCTMPAFKSVLPNNPERLYYIMAVQFHILFPIQFKMTRHCHLHYSKKHKKIYTINHIFCHLRLRNIVKLYFVVPITKLPTLSMSSWAATESDFCPCIFINILFTHSVFLYVFTYFWCFSVGSGK